MTDLLALASRVEGLTEPSKAMDRDIARIVGWHRVEPRHHRNVHGGWIAPEDFLGVDSGGAPILDSLHGTTIHRDPPKLTASLDAVTALIAERLPGWSWSVSLSECGKHSAALMGRSHPTNKNASSEQIGKPVGATPALALLAALLRALYAQQSERAQVEG
jgi:hypothetical protein